MIAKLKGQIDSIQDGKVILDVNGVGYGIFCSEKTLSNCSVGNQASFEVITIIREDAFNLFGFVQPVDKKWFAVLTSVQGVGAKAGLAIQSVLTSDELYTAVASGDKTAFTRASGVGAKLATRIISELKDKVAKIDFGAEFRINTGTPANSSSRINSQKDDINANTTSQLIQDGVSAMVNLGFDRSSAFVIVGKIVSQNSGISVSGIIPLALKELSSAVK